jgi:hypothetical protein
LLFLFNFFFGRSIGLVRTQNMFGHHHAME